MKQLASIVAASAVISAALVGGLAAANGSQAGSVSEPAGWTNPPVVAAACTTGCTVTAQAPKIRVIQIDGRAWPTGGDTGGKLVAR